MVGNIELVDFQFGAAFKRIDALANFVKKVAPNLWWICINLLMEEHNFFLDIFFRLAIVQKSCMRRFEMAWSQWLGKFFDKLSLNGIFPIELNQQSGVIEPNFSIALGRSCRLRALPIFNDITAKIR